MSVVDINKVDGIGISKDGNKLMLLITDHLDWTNEYEHIIHLQNKINAYINFWKLSSIKRYTPISNLSIIVLKSTLNMNCLQIA